MLNGICGYILILVLFLDILMFEISCDNQLQPQEGRPRELDVRWDLWTEWSQCSVDCGTGISIRTRRCRSIIDGQYIDRCHGRKEETKICEIMGCIREVEETSFCRGLEARVFGGKRYRWLPYKHPSRECELACRPVGANFYMGMARNVSDGTSCGENNVNICIGGKCKPVGCDGVVESNAVKDRCGQCGGEGTSCTVIVKTFSGNVKFGYHTIATIPRGARNINVKEVWQSRNYLALKSTDGTFGLNNNLRLDRFGDHPGAGTLFTYERNAGSNCPDECIHAIGPTDVPIEIMILAYTENTGIQYTFSVPMHLSEFDDQREGIAPMVYINGGHVSGHLENTIEDSGDDQQKRPIFSYDFKFRKPARKPEYDEHDTARKFEHNEHADVTDTTTNIVHSTFSHHTQDNRHDDSKNTKETKSDDESVKDKKEALHSTKIGVIDGSVPNTAQDDMYNNDKRVSPLYSWSVSRYTPCSETCGEGKQKPVVECIATDKEVMVEKRYCANLTEPNTAAITCTNGPCPPSWKPTVWSKCSVTCGTGIQVRVYSCVRDDGVEVNTYECESPSPRRDERSCDAGSCSAGWYFTAWPEQCPGTCGISTLKRLVHCISVTGNARTSCPENEKPETEKACRNEDCGGFWLTGPWTKCNATCGHAYKIRAISCALRQGDRVSIVSEGACAVGERPSTYTSCDLEPCKPEWFMTEWSKCSTTCDFGYKSRDVRCLDSDKRPSFVCDALRKPEDRESCMDTRCPLSDQSVPVKQAKNDQDKSAENPNCKDRFVQCGMVLQKNLCQHKYYQKICCLSCNLQGQNT